MKIGSIPLKAIPNQYFEVDIIGYDMTLEIYIKQLNRLLVMDLYKNTELIFKGLNCKLFYDMLSSVRYKFDIDLGLYFIANEKTSEIITFENLGKDVGLCYVI